MCFEIASFFIALFPMRSFEVFANKKWEKFTYMYLEQTVELSHKLSVGWSSDLFDVVFIAPNSSSFQRLLTKLNFIGCQCSNCL